MKKKILLVVTPALLFTLVACNDKNSSTTSATSHLPVSSSSSNTSKDRPSSYTYGDVVSMKGAVDLDVGLGIEADLWGTGQLMPLLSPQIVSSIPVVLNYQVANEEFDFNKIAQYVKFHLSLDVSQYSYFALAADSVTPLPFMGIVQFMVAMTSGMTGGSQNVFDGTDLAYARWVSDDSMPLVTSIDFNYNADGALYISLMGSANDPQVDPATKALTYTDIHSLGTTKIDVNAVILKLMETVTGIIGSVSSFTDIEALLPALSSFELPDISIDLRPIIALLSAFTLDISSGNFDLKATDEGIAYFNGLLTGLASSLIDPSLGMALRLPTLSGAEVKYDANTHGVLVDIKAEASETVGDTTIKYDTSLLKFEIADTTPAAAVFPNTTFAQDYEIQQAALTRISTMADAIENMQYTADSAAAQNTMIADYLKWEKESTVKDSDGVISFTDPAFERVSKFLYQNPYVTSGTAEAPVYAFEKYTKGIKAIDAFFAKLESANLDPNAAESWQDSDWAQLASAYEECAAYDSRGNILLFSDRAADGAKIVAAYEKHQADKEAAALAALGEVENRLDSFFTTYWNTAQISNLTLEETISAVSELDGILFGTEKTVDSLDFTSLPAISTVLTEKDAILIFKLYGKIAVELDKALASIGDGTDARKLGNAYRSILSKLVAVSPDMTIFAAMTESGNVGQYLEASYPEIWKVVNGVKTSFGKLVEAVTSTGKVLSIVTTALEGLAFSKEDLATATDLTVLNRIRTTLNTLYSNLEPIFTAENEIVRTSAASALSAYNDYSDALDARIAALQPAA